MDLPKEVCLILFMGQSNMAGRGAAEQAPRVREGMAYEYKAVSRPGALCPLQEPFGEGEDRPGGVYEPGMKTGSMVSAFVNEFWDRCHIPVVGVSCAKGGSSIAEWMPGTAYYRDAVERCRACCGFLAENGIAVAHRFMAWCQGCTDGDLGTEPDRYREDTARFLTAFLEECGLEACFLIQIGNHRDRPELYAPIQQAQLRLAGETPHVVLVSRQAKTLAQAGLMKDAFHYCQEGYDRIGGEAGRNAARYLLQQHNER